MEYFIGQTFDKHPGGECAVWCNANQVRIAPIGNGRFAIEKVEYEEEIVDTSAFYSACEQFKNVCEQIRLFIGADTFMGGFDEYVIFITSEAAQNDKATASLLANMWSGANEYAKYEGQKIGYGQPNWWYKCWGIEKETK